MFVNYRMLPFRLMSRQRDAPTSWSFVNKSAHTNGMFVRDTFYQIITVLVKE